MEEKDLNANAERLWCTEMKTSLSLLQGALVGSFEGAGFAQPSSALVTAFACERLIFLPHLGFRKRASAHSEMWPEMAARCVFPQELGLPSKGAVVPRADLLTAVPVGCRRDCLKAHIQYHCRL